MSFCGCPESFDEHGADSRHAGHQCRRGAAVVGILTVGRLLNTLASVGAGHVPARLAVRQIPAPMPIAQCPFRGNGLARGHAPTLDCGLARDLPYAGLRAGTGLTLHWTAGWHGVCPYICATWWTWSSWRGSRRLSSCRLPHRTAAAPAVQPPELHRMNAW